MRRISSKAILTLLLVLFSFSAAQAMDLATFEKIANATIKEALSGSIGDIDKLIEDQKKLVKIGVEGCKEYAKKDPEHAKLMNLVTDNAEAMMAMSLDDIEEAWHEAEFLTENGIDVDSIEHFSPALSHMDTVVHPATTYIALKEYKKTGDKDLLEQVKDELSEVLEHTSHLH